MTRPNSNNTFRELGKREELEQLFAYTKRLREDMKRDPEVARQFLQDIGYFEMMEHQRQEEEEEARRAASAPEPPPVERV